MKIRKVFIGIIAVLIMVNLAQAGVSIVKNGSFEDDGAISDVISISPNYWCDVNVPSKFGGKVSTDWSTRIEGGYSLTVYTKATIKYNEGEMAMVSQPVYLTADANQIIFDLKLSSSAGPWNAAARSAVILIDENVVWDSNDWLADSNDEYWNQVVDITGISGVGDGNLHTLSLGIMSNVTESVIPSFIEYRARWDFVKFNAHCGGFGYLPEDLNYDCYVNFIDYAMLANFWLQNVAHPDDIYDLTADDNFIDEYDVMLLAASWLDYRDWTNWESLNLTQLEGLDADLNDDGVVDLRDYAILAEDWTNGGGCVRGDINRSGTVDYEDVLEMSYEWLMKSWMYGAN